MAQTEGVTTIAVYHGGGEAPASIATEYNREAGSPRPEAESLSRLFAAISSGVRPAKVRVRTDSAVGVRASLLIAVTQANIAAGETIALNVPGRPPFVLTAVAADPVVANGEFVSETDDDTTADNILAAAQGLAGLSGFVTTSVTDNDVTFTAVEYGTVGNAIKVIDGTTNGITPAGGALAGGVDTSTAVTSSVTCVAANTDADDTITIGGVVFTAKASGASGEGQFNIGASNTAMGDNLLAKIVAHSKLAGLVTGVSTLGVIVLTWQCDPRLAILAGYMATSDADGLVLTAQPASTLTLANVTATRTYALGAP